MKACIVLVALLGVALAEEGCQCPDFVNAVAAGKQIFSSGDSGSVAMQPCCETLLKYKNQFKNGGLASKHTPGMACETLTDCAQCTILSFCRFKIVHAVSNVDVENYVNLNQTGGGVTNQTGTNQTAGGATNQTANQTATGNQTVTGSCVDVSSIDELDLKDYTQKCVGHNVQEFFTAAELRKDPDAPAFYQHVRQEDQPGMTHPVIAYRGEDWPVDFHGYLPPAGSTDPKYPSGIPGFGDYVNEMSSTAQGHMTTDVVSDPRLPVASHVPAYPLSGNPQLPDKVVNHGGHDEVAQPIASWVHPDFNHNGCLGGPCDPIDQQPCTGLACGGAHRKGGDAHAAGVHHAHEGYVE